MAHQALPSSEGLVESRSLGPLVTGALTTATAVAGAALVAHAWLGLPAQHVKDLMRFLLETGGVSLAVSMLAAWIVLVQAHGRLAFKLAVVCAIGPSVAAINTYYTADAMLINHGDLGLLILLLTFSAGVGFSFALALARSLAARITYLAQAARAIGAGSGDVQAPEGGDEVGDLGRTINQLAAQLRQSDRMRRDLEEARHLLLAAVSHDLRTPLTSLRATLEAIDDGVVQDEQTSRRYLGSARQQVRQLETLIEDLFELARLDAGALQLTRTIVPVGALVVDVVESMYIQAERAGITLEMRVSSDLPSVEVDPERIGRVLLNLMSNALRFTPAGGRIVVAARRDGQEALISVHDTGSGIAPDDLPHIFDRFYRGEKSRSRQHGGAGLGLAIARGLIDAHGGRIWAESTPAGGTTFYVSLPVAEGPSIDLQQNRGNAIP